ncbi:FAD-dependent monooxygenase paxM-like [Ananas comosus]|uniref:FAD-dependent monooxygenase paxM-like n=1 Tax=Ananas comosus TaxID=4615 RepID=A0A6P5GFU2_ANACO|nr:FAD-dependent monooxygenase paxM-like [Ananas comosus]
MAEAEEGVVIVGAGIAGLATAAALTRMGVRGVIVLEKSHELHTTGAVISIFPNGWRALRALGVAHKLANNYPSYKMSRVMNLETGETREINLTGTMDRVGIGVRTIHRKVLLSALAEELPPDTIRFSSKLVSVRSADPEDSTSHFISLHLDNGSIIKTKVLIGCDGVHSVVAQWLGLSAPIDSDRSAVRGLAEFSERHGFQHQLHQYISHDKMAGFVPVNDREVYWFISHDTSHRDREMTRHPKLIIRQVTRRLARGFPDEFLDVVRNTDPSTLTWTQIHDRAPWALLLGPWAHMGRATVLGDALHPTTVAPDLPLGGCAALELEDAVVLARHVGPALTCADVGAEEALAAYVSERRWRVVGLAAGAYVARWAQRGAGGARYSFRRRLVEWVLRRFVGPRMIEAVNYDCGDLDEMD